MSPTMAFESNKEYVAQRIRAYWSGSIPAPCFVITPAGRCCADTISHSERDINEREDSHDDLDGTLTQ